MPRFRKLFNGIRKRLKQRKGNATDDNVYAEANDDFDAAPSATGTAGQMVNHTPFSHPQPPSYPPPVNTKSRIATDHPSNTSNSSNSNNNTTTETAHRGSDSKDRHSALLPPTSKKPEIVNNTKSDGQKQPIWHDVNGYAMPFPKSGHSATPENGARATSAASTENSRTVHETGSGTQNGGVSSSAVVASKSKADKDSTAHGERLRDKAKKKEKTRKGSDTGTYCNVIIADNRSSSSFSNELYEQTDIHAQNVPVKPRAANKPADNQEKSQLNYIQIEFVNQAEVTSKRPKVKRSSSPTQYTDVINENGVVRLMT